MIRRYCDLCERELRPGKLVLSVVVAVKEGALTDDDGQGELECCQKCVDELHRAMAEIAERSKQ